MKKMYYRCWYRLDSYDRYLIWYNVEEVDEDLDGVVLDAQGDIPIFDSSDALLSYAQNQNISLVTEEPILHDLDVLAQWSHIKQSSPASSATIDCDAFLSAWNLFADVSRSLGAHFDSDREKSGEIYMKLFWGNNLPSLTPEGKCFIPTWSEDEEQVINEILSQGLQMFRESIRVQ